MTLTNSDVVGMTVSKVATTHLDPLRAQCALLRVMAVMGSVSEWDSSTIESVAEAARRAWHGTQLPDFTDQSEEAIAFWKAIP